MRRGVLLPDGMVLDPATQKCAAICLRTNVVPIFWASQAVGYLHDLATTCASLAALCAQINTFIGQTPAKLTNAMYKTPTDPTNPAAQLASASAGALNSLAAVRAAAAAIGPEHHAAAGI